jgi:uncharacterized protein YukE
MFERFWDSSLLAELQRKWNMPIWHPNWEDVQFDHGEANEAVMLCQGALVTLADRHAVLQGPYQMACLNWRGVNRYRFDAEWSAIHAQAESIAEQLHEHIVKLRHESAAAVAEQRLREADRARWFREKATEEAKPPELPPHRPPLLWPRNNRLLRRLQLLLRGRLRRLAPNRRSCLLPSLP